MAHTKRTRLTSLPPRALQPIAQAIASGDSTYGRWTWLDRPDAEDDIGAALGHIAEALAGKTEDEHSGLHPIVHAAARLVCVVERLERGEGLGDWLEPPPVQD